jgi:uncharacterized membrane protein
MAGIGFALRSLAQQDTLNAGLRSQIHATAVASGPWLFTVLALGALELFAAGQLEREDLRLFAVVVIYNFAFSLVISGPVVLVVTRHLADLIYLRDAGGAPGMLLGALGLLWLVQAAIGLPFYLYAVEMEAAERLLAICGFFLVGGVWLASAFLSALKSYGSITAAFGIGMAVAYGLARLLTPAHGVLGMLGGFTAGLALLFFGLVARVLAEYPYRVREPFAFLPAIGRYWELALFGFFYNAAIWVDKWIMWSAPGRMVIAGGMSANPTYDGAMFLASLSMAPAATLFLLVVETRFFERYLRFYRAIEGHATVQEIRRNHREILRVLVQGFRNVAVLQTAACYLFILAAPGLIGMARGGLELVPTFRFGVLGALFHALLLPVIAVISYFDLRRLLLAVSVVFFVVNAALTWAALQLGLGYAGYGYFLAALLTLAFAYLGAARRIARLPYMTFIANNRGLH